MSSNESFAFNLELDSGQKSITSLVENEVRILHNLRKFLLAEIKAGKDYSGTLGSDATVTMKALAGVNNARAAAESGGTMVNKMSLHILEEVQSAKNKENIEFLSGTTLPNLDKLIAEKKLMGKLAAEHYHRIKGRLVQFREMIHKSMTEYSKNFKLYQTARTKYEDQCTKGNGSNKTTDATMAKFLNAIRGFNICHAEFLIVIHEASEYKRDFQTILLPGLLQAQQTWLETQASRWKEILDQIWKNGPWLSSLQSKMKDFEFNNEYLELISKHKSQPLQSMNVQLEPAQHSSLPFYQTFSIVNSGTMDFLQSKLSDLSKRIKSLDLVLEKKQDQQSKQKNSLLDQVRQFEINELRCESDRARSTKMYIDTLIGGKITDTPMSTNISVGANPSGNEANEHLPMAIIEKGITSLVEEEWFHGVLPREDADRLLRQDGDYLIRETTINEERQIVLSVFWNGPIHFIIPTTPDGQFRFEGPKFPTVKQLLSHYVQNQEPITNRSGTLVNKPMKRENWELNNDDVELIEEIGKGKFVDVYKASYNGQLVVVKTCKVNLPEEQRKSFLQEGRVLKQFDHPNIVKLVGICVQKQPIMIVMELVPGGSLLAHLKGKGGTMTVKNMSKLGLDATAGMTFLEEKGCLHRNLAARNCLLDSNGCLKISDFKMSRKGKEYTVSDGMKQIPIKWTAPEALKYGKYTPLSDVWSYGILMWEIFSRGQTPYQGLTNAKSSKMVKAGYRMPAPDGAPDVINQLMARCWQYEPEQRPRFSEIYSELLITVHCDLI